MKRLLSILLAVFIFSILTSCNSTKPASLKNEISPAELTTEQQDIIDLLSIPDNSELMIFNYNTEDTYRRFEVWVEVYQDGEIISQPAGIGLNSDTAEKHSGRLAISISKNDLSYQWTLSLVENGGKSSHIGRTEAPDDAALARAYGSINESVIIEEGKEIILYSSVFSGNDILPFYDGITLQERPELLKDFPVVYLIKCKFFN